MTNRTAAAKLAVCKWIRGQVGKWEDEAKAELRDMVAGDRQAALLAGYQIGTVTMCDKRELRAIDENRLAEWVGERWPEEVEHIVQVRPDFRRVLAARAREHGALIDNVLHHDAYRVTTGCRAVLWKSSGGERSPLVRIDFSC